MAKTLTMDASALGAQGFDSTSYFADFFAGIADDGSTFYGGTPDAAFGSTYYMNGSQNVRTYNDGTDPVSSAVMLDGADIAYDFIHYGAHMGHGITGSVDSMWFGDWIDGTTTGTEGTGAAGRVSGFGTEVVVDGLDLFAAPGSGSDASTNEVYSAYKNVQNGDAAGLDALFSQYAVEMTGTSSADRLIGYSNDDVLIGHAGADVLNGAAGADVLLGNRGADKLRGGDGADMLLGGNGNDNLFGGRGADALKGGSGDDVLNGAKGTDRLTGGDGADTFVMLANSGRDTITDFDTSEDMIDVSALGLTQLSDFTISETASKTVLTSGSVEIHLLDIAQADLSDDLFVF